MVLAGYALPGQTSEQLLDSLAPDLFLDFIHGYLLSIMDPKQVEKFEAQLAEASKTPAQRLAERREQARRNIAVMNRIKK